MPNSSRVDITYDYNSKQTVTEDGTDMEQDDDTNMEWGPLCV